ncbi:glycosyltransferase [Pontibaca salina]|uniref:Glycosyltransferase family 2 protein n=1 Tax=Pontibaca salina TaxID=2795731 RepID=A0A934HU87_9RHOB|nr:glycosyltransferase family A protein [Pontibaca salina]MBI6630630.1 glycosyltransferase family 2 protein [Pontibaca salina]
MSRPNLGAVAIGRNEGARLRACLRSLIRVCDRVVYVDSGSSDDSVAFARSLGVIVVELDLEIPFTAARARNAGFAALAQQGPLDLVQFVDGDCEVVPGWLEAGVAALAANPGLGLVTGWRREIHPEASVYNALFEADWHRPAGPITTCGGDMMVRTQAFRQIGGFTPHVIAAEDDEFCLRLGQAGWQLERLARPMTLHDANMKSFGPWWKRSIRDGHGFAQVGWMHPAHFRRERLRVWVYGLVLPLIFLLGLSLTPWISILVLAVYAMSYLRTARNLRQRGVDAVLALKQAFFLTISKFPNLSGMLIYHHRRRKGGDMQIIEYK